MERCNISADKCDYVDRSAWMRGAKGSDSVLDDSMKTCLSVPTSSI